MTDTQQQKQSELHTVRDTVESIWVAIVLAFLLRAFMVEAFVIPTGSMAPRLFGEHWMLQCPACPRQYAYGIQARRGSQLPSGATCPNCGFDYPFSREDLTRARSGDRVLVLKYIYQFSEPSPWDVVVFKNPQDNHQNYIKRLIGLPGETIEIVHGDIYVSKDGQDGFQIRRKPHRVQQVMWQTLFDNDFLPDAEVFARYNQMLRRQSLPSQWFPFWRPGSAQQARAWDSLEEVQVSPSHRKFRIARTAFFKGAPEPHELVFDAQRDKFLPHYGYNSDNGAGMASIDENLDVVSDLKLSVSYAPDDASSKLTLHLSSFDHRFQAVVNAAGTLELRHQKIGYGSEPNGSWQTWATRKLDGFTGKITEIALTHVDFTARVWVDGELILASTPSQYAADYEQMKRRLGIRQRMDELSRDLSVERFNRQRSAAIKERQRKLEAQQRAWFKTPPEVRMIVEGGPCKLMHLKLMRDVYYTNSRLDSRLGESAGSEFAPLLKYAQRLRDSHGLLEDRRQSQEQSSFGWGVTDHPIHLDDHPGKSDLDEFFVLGDNSPQSHDSRSWVMASPTLRLFDEQGRPQYKLGTVPRYNLLGRAMYVYWPAGFRIPRLNVPLIPNVGRMRFIK